MTSHRLVPSLLLFIFFACVIILLTVFFSFEKITSSGPLKEPVFFVVQKGKSTSSIAQDLYQAKIIDSPHMLTLWVRLFKKKIKAGEYKFLPAMSLRQVINLLNEGKLVTHKLTIPEGLTSSEIVQLLRNNPLLEGFVPEIPPEGSLFPTTFLIHRGQDRLSLIQRMTVLMTQAREILDKNHPSSGSLSSQERLILASIIEKETYIPQERPLISGVFHNRLQKKMPLQADPCIIYALTLGRFKLNRPLNRRDLSVDSPYNTYQRPGLPPTPICNPGRASLEAAYAPMETSSFYFVVKPDGSHQFSRDYAAHAHHHKQLRAYRKNCWGSRQKRERESELFK